MNEVTLGVFQEHATLKIFLIFPIVQNGWRIICIPSNIHSINDDYKMFQGYQKNVNGKLHSILSCFLVLIIKSVLTRFKNI